MMKTLFAVLAVLTFTNPAFAAVIDFTDSGDGISGASWNGTIDGVGVTLDAAPTGAVLQQSSYGVGVNYDEGYLAGMQIEGEELLTVTFDDLQDVSGFTVTNLYETSGWGFLILGQDEKGSYTIDGTEYIFEADSATGVLSVDFNEELGGAVTLQSITFKAVNNWNSFIDNGFTLQSITTVGSSVATAVPELDAGAMPGALAVLVGGILVLGGRRRERV